MPSPARALLLAPLLLLLVACHGPRHLETVEVAPTAQGASPSNERWEDHPRLTAEVDPDHFDEAAGRAAIYFATNEVRRKHGLSTLQRSELLEVSAQEHARRMRDLDFFAHEDPFDAAMHTPQERGAWAGIGNPMMAENIAQGPTIQYGSGQSVFARGGRGQFSLTAEGPLLPPHTYVTLARALVESWMNSPGHRKNILSKDAVELGCGVVFLWLGDFPSVEAVQNFQLYEPVTPSA